MKADRILFPPKQGSIYNFTESYLPPKQATDLTAHYTSNSTPLNVATGSPAAPSNIYHATDPGPIGFANLQATTAPNACDVTPQLRQEMHSYTSYPNTYMPTRPDPLQSH